MAKQPLRSITICITAELMQRVSDISTSLDCPASAVLREVLEEWNAKTFGGHVPPTRYVAAYKNALRKTKGG